MIAIPPGSRKHTYQSEDQQAVFVGLAELAEKEDELARESKCLKEVEDRLNFTKREQDATRQALEIEIN